MANRFRLEQIQEFYITPTVTQHGKVPKWNNNTKRFDWSSSFVELGIEHSNAYFGDLGKIAYDHSRTSHASVVAPGANENVLVSNGTVWTSGSVPGRHLPVTLATNHGLSLNIQTLALGTPSTITSTSTNSVTTTTHTHAITGYVIKSGDTGLGNMTFNNNAVIDVVSSVGSDVLNIGTGNADVVNIGYSGSTVNINGTLSYQAVDNLTVKDKLITLNKGGSIDSGVSSGFEIEENSVIKGWFTTSAGRTGFEFRAPAINYSAILSLINLTAERTFTLPNASGTIALTTDLSSGYVPYTGATGAVNLGAYDLTVNGLTIGKGGGAIATNTIVSTSILLSNSTGYGNTAIGYDALYNNTTGGENVSIGYLSLKNNTIGGFNTALGNGTLYANKGKIGSVAIGYHAMYYADNTISNVNSYNTAIGVQALMGSGIATNNTGLYNTTVGYQAMYSNTSGTGNSTLGVFSLLSNITGNYNTAFGQSAMKLNTDGDSNTGIGNKALYSNTTADNNTAVGDSALYYNTTGHENVAVGQIAGSFIADSATYNTTSNTSVYLGYATKAKLNGGINEIVVGANTIGNGSNTATWGNTNITNHYFVGSGAFTTSVVTPTVLATLNDSGALGASGTAFSDLFLASGGVINWNAGNVTLTHTTSTLSLNGLLNITGGLATTYGVQNIQLPVNLAVGAGLSTRQETGESIIQFGNNYQAHYTGVIDSSKAGVMIRLDTRNGTGNTSYGSQGYTLFQIQTRVAGTTTSEIPFQLTAAPSGSFIMNTLGNIGFGILPTANLHPKAGTATVNTSPLKLTQTGAIVLTTPEAGAFECNDGDLLYYTIKTGPTRKTIAFTDSVITSSMFIGTTSVALNRSSAALTLAGITLTTPDIGTPSAGVMTNVTGTAVNLTSGKATNLVGGNNTTLLGSIPYQSNTDTTTLLSPNTTTTKKWLSQTGTGTNGAVPTWTTVAVSDLTYLLNDEWLKTYDYAGNTANLVKLSKDNIVEFGAPVGINSLYHVLNSGFNDIVNIPVDISSPDNTQHGVGITIGGQRLFSVSALATATTTLVDIYLINTAATISSSVINPLLTLAESWIGPSSTTGIYFNDGNVGIGQTVPVALLNIAKSTQTNETALDYLRINGGPDPTNLNIGVFASAGGPTRYSYLQSSDDFASRALVLQPNGGNDGNVGIGQTVPGSLLSVAGGISAGTYSATAAPANGMIISGNVGIGTTNPISLLNLKGGNITLGSNAAAGDSFGRISARNDSSLTWVEAAAIDFIRPNGNWGNEGEIRFYTNPGDVGQSASSQRMVIDRTGNVGIGTTGPVSLFDVTGSSATQANPATTGTTATGIVRFRSYNNVLDIGSTAANTIWMQSANSTDLGVFYPIALNPNGGNVGIGLTDPTSRLHLSAGSATAGTAPLGFTSGALLTTRVAGKVEFLTDDYYATITTSAIRKIIAWNPTQTDVTASRALNTTYTNTGTRSIMVTATVRCAVTLAGGNAYVQGMSDAATPSVTIATGLVGIQAGLLGEDNSFQISFIVAAGKTYQITPSATNGTCTLGVWFECSW